jgi:hypothetical protein
MQWKMLFSEKEKVLSVKTYGIFELTTKTELMKECIVEIEKQNYCWCLIDNNEIESAQIEVFELYSIPKKLAELGAPRNLRIAEVFSEKHRKDFDFLEIVCHNRCYQLSVFSDMELAMQWLRR